MIREWDLNDVSDGKKYGLSDMVKADCDDCKGCSACCHGMGKSIVLDPLDIYRLVVHLNMPFEALLGDNIELNIVDGVILPNLKCLLTITTVVRSLTQMDVAVSMNTDQAYAVYFR
jgi:hypothetical protein